ncbi:MipA/OmpV family protein [Leeia aquatica]|uniref:MipA/OmpV family protein n=1 Tax=Leeia aquatica TaxID=2725557 RepID=A0A847S5L0_9NEIS|nr:MipA/OmpV family protein [Leeia aquatica]NLR74387.1 MipA/OmpV family protein [Leeia aquatica]
MKQLGWWVGMMLLAAGAQVRAEEAAAPDNKDNNWSVTLGAGVVSGPKYPGASKRESGLMPIVNVTYRDMFFLDSMRGLGVQYPVSEHWSAYASIAAGDERKEKDDNRLKGLGDIKARATFNLGAEWEKDRWKLGVSLSRRMGKDDLPGQTGRKGGMLTSIEGSYAVVQTQQTEVSVGLSATHMNKAYAETFFGVNARQASQSGLRSFEAKGGLRDVELFIEGKHQLDKHWSLLGRVGVSKLRGDAARSPITQKSRSVSAFFGAAYTF